MGIEKNHIDTETVVAYNAGYEKGLSDGQAKFEKLKEWVYKLDDVNFSFSTCQINLLKSKISEIEAKG